VLEKQIWDSVRASIGWRVRVADLGHSSCRSLGEKGLGGIPEAHVLAMSWY
jgi:hypothetical protein